MQISSNTRRLILKASAGTALGGVLISSFPGMLFARNDRQQQRETPVSSGVAVYDGYPEICTPGNNVVYVPAKPAATKIKLADVFLW